MNKSILISAACAAFLASTAVHASDFKCPNINEVNPTTGKTIAEGDKTFGDWTVLKNKTKGGQGKWFAHNAWIIETPYAPQKHSHPQSKFECVFVRGEDKVTLGRDDKDPSQYRFKGPNFIKDIVPDPANPMKNMKASQCRIKGASDTFPDDCTFVMKAAGGAVAAPNVEQKQ